MTTRRGFMGAERAERGVALLAVLFALMLLMLLALPFSVSMGVGAEAASREVDQTAVEQASASVRDLLLATAARSHPAFDPTPDHDDLAEFPDHVELPPAFEPLRGEGRVLLGGEVWDLQRYLSLDSVSPLVLANLLGTTTRLREDLLPGAVSMTVEGADALPESGFVWVGHEVIRYGGKQGDALLDLTRAMFLDLGFADGKQPIAAQALVLDYRCVVAATWPFTGRGGANRATRRSFASIGELAEIAAAGIGSFTADEIDTLRAALSVDVMPTTSATWGRPERVFGDLQVARKDRSLRVRSGLHIGAGSTVRLRNLRTGTIEHGLVIASESERQAVTLTTPLFRLDLLLPVVQDWPAIDTVVEPLVPSPVNVNTAPVSVLTAVFEEVRRSSDMRVHEADGQRRTAPPLAITRQQAKELAEEIVARRSATEAEPGVAVGPFTGWQDFAERLMKPRFEAASGNPQKQVWLYLYRNLQTGRESVMEMGTAPVCFASGPWVGYRAAASRSRSVVAPGVAGRHERSGLAAVVPGFTLEHAWNTQVAFEDAFQLDRRSPYWITSPINLGSLQQGEVGNDPAPRYFPHVVPFAYPDLGLGSPRFAAKDPADAGIGPAPTTVRFGRWSGPQSILGFDSFAQTLDPRGHDAKKVGPYEMQNTGPRGGAGGGAAAAAGGGRHDKISFPFANGDSFMGRFAVSFWVQPQSLANVTLLDHSDGDADRNRMSVRTRDDQLVFEVIDEAGIDPEPSKSPAGIQRTATEWTLPLAELGLPADTPLHLSVSAYGSRPSELNVAVDGMTRGKVKYQTYLTSPLKVFDPSLANNKTLPGQPGNDRWLDVQVESTEGFPPVGTLRIGTEIFEYSGISGNAFQCQWKDSLGGRGARMIGREGRPDIPVDANGEPTVDINAAQLQGVNLDVFPAHPVGAMVELYGYSTQLSEDSPMMVGTTRLDGAIGGFAIARGWINNPKPIVISPPTGTPFPIGVGLDEVWTGELELADPIPTGRDYPPPAAQESIANAFPTTGGYALLIQRSFNFESNQPGQVSSSTRAGGVELIRYTSRQGTKLSGVQRAQTLPGNDSQISTEHFQAGTAQRFVTNFTDWPWDDPQTYWDDIPTLILWVVPVSLSLQGTQNVWDPVQTGLTEWVQLYPEGGDVNDTEWVRYDSLAQGKYICRANRAAWDRVRYELTQSNTRETVQVGPLGPTATPGGDKNPPWGSVQTTSGYIGYTPRLESDFPQIRAARNMLLFRGDPMWDFFGESLQATSSHPHSNSVVMQCQRLELSGWGNFGAFTGRVGRNDRVALVQGSQGNGSKRPTIEWQTVNWSARRFNSDNLAQNQQPSERLGPWPFQLVAFQAGVQNVFIGPPRGPRELEPRLYDRVVKFPSGELPAAWCESVTVGASTGKAQPVNGFVDEIEVRSHALLDLVVEEEFAADAKTFRIVPGMSYNAMGALYLATDPSADYPITGGLVSIDGEILAYQAHANGVFTVATNGRGLLNTEPKDHDRGARVHFLSHRPMAILAGNVGPRDTTLPIASLGPMGSIHGTVLLGRELLHYTWVMLKGDQAALEMPRWFPPGEDPTSAAARGLFRGRFGTTPQGGSSGEAAIAFPFRYWDRHADQSDDPELAYSQLTSTETPVFYRALRWREETTDPRVRVVCLVRTDSKAPWWGEPGVTPGLWRFEKNAEDDAGHRIGAPGSRIEIRFASIYKPGVLDLTTFRAHGWKTTVRVEDVRLEYEGQARIFDERVTAR